MIERKFISNNFKEFQIKNFIKGSLNKVGLSAVKLQKTSLGEKVIIKSSRPGLVVGRGGSTIKKLTTELKNDFNLENPQIELEEINNFNLDATVVAEGIAAQLERFGTQRFKGVGHKTVEAVMRSGALGVEILISGKVPSSRAKTWRFTDGYMKKCGDIAITGVDHAIEAANLKTGTVGIQVRIMPPTTVLPDAIAFNKREEEAKAKLLADEQEAKKAERKSKAKASKESKEESKEKKAPAKKKTTTKKATKKVEKVEEAKAEAKEESSSEKKVEDKEE